MLNENMPPIREVEITNPIDTTPIIVNGVPCSSCEFFTPPCEKYPHAVCSCIDARNCEGDIVLSDCEENPNCYYKQYMRKAEENKKLVNDLVKHLSTGVTARIREHKYQSALEEIREVLKPYLTECLGSLCEPIDEALKKIEEALK